MKKEIFIKENIILVQCGNEFATFTRRPNDENVQTISFSIPITTKDVELLEQSGIVEVENYSALGQLVFKRLNFYETHLMAELITDILQKHHEKENI